MRSEGPIFPLCMMVARNWQYACPDMRFMQLLSNVSEWYKEKYKKDPFYLEDEEFMTIFQEYMEKMRG